LLQHNSTITSAAHRQARRPMRDDRPIVDRLEDMARFERISVVRAGEDILETYRRLT